MANGVPVNDWSALASILKNAGLSSSDISRLFSPELGQLTGTFTAPADQNAYEQQVSWLDNAPTLLRTLGLPDNDIRKIIAAEIQRGSNPWDIKRMVEEYTAKQAEMNPGVYNQEGETRDLLSFVDTIDREFNAKQVSDLKAARSAGKDELAKAGLPSADARFTAQEIAPEFFDMLTKRVASTATQAQQTQAGLRQRTAAAKFLEDRQKAATGAQPKKEMQPSAEFKGAEESIIGSLRRNLANTPMGRGEAGVRGLVPLYKLLEQVPAGAAGLFRGLTDPIYDEAIGNLKYVAETTLGRQLPRLSQADPLGQILYGRPRAQIAEERAASAAPVEDEGEMRRFGRVAERIVEKPFDVQAETEKASRLSRQARLMDQAKQMLASYAEEKMASRGVTPLMQALAARANFIASGGK